MTDIQSLRRNSESLKRGFQTLSEIIAIHRQFVILLLAFLINLLLVSPSLMPEIYEINPDDEAKYVESGWRLVEGNLRDLAWGPIVALVYAPIHIVVVNSPDWFMIETWVGRYILYAFLWWSVLYLAFQFKEYASPYIISGVLFINTPFFIILNNQSDAVFLGFSALALSQLIKFSHYHKLRALGLSSLFVGLGVLARVETVILIATLTLLSLIISRGKSSARKIILTAIVPALCIMGFYLLISFIIMGSINLGIGYKSYDSFEMNQAILTGGDINLARQESRRLFGTQEENHGSILRAIWRNPSAYALRILANAKTIPDNYLAFFGKKLGPILLLFAFWGAFVLLQKKAFLMLVIILAWATHALVSLGFLSLHIIPQVSYLPLLLGAIGIAGLINTESHTRGRVIFLFTTLLCFLMSWITDKPAFMIGFLLVVVVLIITWLLQANGKLTQVTSLGTVFLLLTVGLILREPYLFPNYPELGATDNEQAIHYLEANLPPQTMLLVPSPLQAIAAKMSYITMDAIPGSITTLDEFWNFLKQGNVQSIVVDTNRRVRNDIYDLFEKGYDPYFIHSYSSPNSTIRIFSVK